MVEVKKKPGHGIFVRIALSRNEGSDESAHAQTRQSLRCSHEHSMDVDEDSEQNIDF